MPLPSSINDLSTTAGSNSPAGSESPSLIDDYLRTYASYIAILRDNKQFPGAMNNATPQTIASATTTDIGAATSNSVYISGTTTITGMGTIAAGATRTVRFLGALVLTHNATSLILPGGASITTALNDTAEFLSLGSGNWLCLCYSLANGKMVANPVGTVSQSGGVPTGALMESGSNGNGRYSKYADGTMICTRTVAINQAINFAAGPIFYSQVAAQAYAASFVGAVPTVEFLLEDTIGLSWPAAGTAGTLTACPLINMMAPISRTSASYTLYITAIGRWF